MVKIDKYKLFEYAYDELPEKEMAEVEEIIANDPKSLKIVNEYLFLKQNLKELPAEAPAAIPKKTKDESRNCFKSTNKTRKSKTIYQ